MSVSHEEILAKVEANRQICETVLARMAAMDKKFDNLIEMQETYNAIKRGGKVVEWLSKVIAACLVIWAFVKGFWQLLLETGK